jgi:hypothetical protein
MGSDSAAKAKEREPLGVTLKKAAKRALGGGIAGALAMVIQVLALMWMRTTINYQYKFPSLTMMEVINKLYAEGGIARFYQGMSAALLQGPLSRFGDTASNAGAIALLEQMPLPAAVKTILASVAAGLFRILLSPVDTIKTSMQINGNLDVLMEKFAAHGPQVFFAGSLGTAAATFAGHYPWFFVFNFLNGKIDKMEGKGAVKRIRDAIIGLCASATSDTVSNSLRVLKVQVQDAGGQMGYLEAANAVIAKGGLSALFLGGLGTKLISNGLQAMLFTVCWRLIEEKLAARNNKEKTK